MKSESQYEEKVKWLFNQFPAFQKIGDKAYKPTLEHTLSLVKLLGTPFNTMKFVHVAGTNGKGTTCSIIASVLQESGKKVGLFTSPHIIDFRERIRINGTMISKDKVIHYIDFFKQQSLSFAPSFFELTWVMALDYFYKEKCDIIVAETGLGGRLDATNCIEPLISVITNVGMDHVSILGDTRQAIIKEKAGIIKSRVPVIVGEDDVEIQQIILPIAEEKDAPVSFLNLSNISTAFDANKLIAIQTIDYILPKSKDNNILIEKGIKNISKNTGWFGRYFQYSKNPIIIIDAAHNEMAVKKLIATIQKDFSTFTIRALFGASSDKDLDSMCKYFPKDWQYYITTFLNKRSYHLDDLKNFKGFKDLDIKFFNSVPKAFEAAKSIEDKATMLLVFGSFYMLEEILS